MSCCPGCNTGLQSPIKINPKFAAPLTHEISLLGAPADFKSKLLKNDNPALDTIRSEVAPGTALVIDDVAYTLKQFHFHFPPEHHIIGDEEQAGELHFVFENDKGELAVMAVFIKKGFQKNRALKEILDEVPGQRSPLEVLQDFFGSIQERLERLTSGKKPLDKKTLASMLLGGGGSNLFFTMGSLTMPDEKGEFKENVPWVICRNSIEASKEQIALFKEHIGHPNARAFQAPNGREIQQGNFLKRDLAFAPDAEIYQGASYPAERPLQFAARPNIHRS